MACKYKYNNEWYSKEELQNILYKERGIDKYGKLVKPEINETLQDNVIISHPKGGIIFEGTQTESKKFLNDFDLSIYKNLDKDKLKIKQSKGIQPTTTNETLKESIESVKNKLKGSITDEYGTEYKLTAVPVMQFPNNKIGDIIKLKGYDYKILAQTAEQEDWDGSIEPEMWKIEFVKIDSKKEYTSQALINTKIAALKEVAKKYPRSLIRSEVKRINTSSSQELYDQFGADELPFQKVSKDTQDLFDKIMNTPSRVIDEKIKNCL